MSLANDISAMQVQMTPNIPTDVLDTILAATQELVESHLAMGAIKVGDKAPDFSLPNHEGEKFSLQQALQSGPVVINFYRGSWCPYCNKELTALNLSIEEIKKLGATLVAISPNKQDVSASFVAKNPFSFDVLSDIKNRVAHEYGLVFTLAEQLRPIYHSFGFNIPADNGDGSYELPIPATYIVNPDGVISHAFVDADYTKRMEPEDILTALSELTTPRRRS